MFFVSSNKNKILEIKKVLPNISSLPLSVKESGLTFFENALLKARAGATKTNQPCIGDDSGIMVDALGGAPGIYSKRWQGATNSEEAIQNVLRAMESIPKHQRTAQMVCVLAFVKNKDDYLPEFFIGTQQGLLLDTPSGSKGFAYDPYFYDLTDQMSNASITIEEKNTRSHRGKALKKLAIFLSQHNY